MVSSFGSNPLLLLDPIDYPVDMKDTKLCIYLEYVFLFTTCNIREMIFVLYIGKISRTYGRRKGQNGSLARLIPRDRGESSHSEGKDPSDEEIPMSREEKALEKEKTKTRKKRPPPLPVR